MTNRMQASSSIVKLNRDEYMNKLTGEVLQYNHTENRLENTKSVKATIRKLRRIINANVLHSECCRWLTLTYAENMTDTKRLYDDFQAFWKRLVRWCKKNNIPVPEYISVVEPQARGAWHIHLILIWRDPAPFISNNDVVQPLWGHGFTKTKALNDVDNIGAYFSAYLADMPLDELQDMEQEVQMLISGTCETVTKSFQDDNETVKDKKFIKGARLFLYPTGTNLFRTSRGIRKPVEGELPLTSYWDIVATYERDEKKASLGELTFSSASVVSVAGRPINKINRFYFNTKRVNSTASITNARKEKINDESLQNK